ncbi:MAG: transposase [Campylobacterales bacterium]|nr:transposase [Campylobacterales bacterium]
MGEIIDDKMFKSNAGRMVEQIWYQIPVYNPGIHLHEFTMMPNHIHGIVELENASISLSGVIQKFKSMTTCKYIDGVRNHLWETFDKKLWQRNYYEHIIRNDQSLDTIQNYIINNPKNWENDKLYRAT